MTLLEKQQAFAEAIGQLLAFIYARGWAVTFGDAWRPDAKGHMPGSLHYSRLAIDLNLFVRGVWMDTDCPEWQELGVVWKTFHELARWGGDFRSRDLNHFSFEHEGRA